jgi:2,4-dienoyl-CoA reductase-like NADH-dependent reductase (Old Yellow Enzyme family)
MGSTHPSDVKVVKAEGLTYFTPANNGGVALSKDASSVPTLFRPLKIRDVTLKHRIVVSPMCMYSAEPDPKSPAFGALTDYHIAHLGHLALKGASLIIIEAQAVQPNGRISPNDAGLWDHDTNSEQFLGLKRVVDFAHAQGAKVAVQLAHAGRKASVMPPWVAAEQGIRSLRAESSQFGWPENVVAPTGGPDMVWSGGGAEDKQYHVPRTLSTDEIKEVVKAFAASAATAVKAGVDVVEVHGAHGYLVHQFLSPVTNKRTDEYGGSFENRTRIVREIAAAIREAIPSGVPIFLRVSATEWLDGTEVAKQSGSWGPESTIKLAKELPSLGVDLIDVSSGSNHRDQKIDPHTSYQIDLAARVRKELHESGVHNLLVGAVGLVTTSSQAKDIVEGADTYSGIVKDEAQAAESLVSGPEPKADAVFVARQFLRDPAWVLNVAKELGVKVSVPHQFQRAL